MKDAFAPPTSKLSQSGIGVAAAPTGGMGVALDPDGKLRPPTLKLDSYYGACSGDLTLTTAYQDIAGATVTLIRPGTHHVVAVFDLEVTGAGTGVLLGQALQDGTALSGNGLLAEAAGRATVTQQWIVSTTVASSVVKLQAKKSINAGTAVAHQTHSNLIAVQIS